MWRSNLAIMSRDIEVLVKVVLGRFSLLPGTNNQSSCQGHGSIAVATKIAGSIAVARRQLRLAQKDFRRHDDDAELLQSTKDRRGIPFTSGGLVTYWHSAWLACAVEFCKTVIFIFLRLTASLLTFMSKSDRWQMAADPNVPQPLLL